MGKIIHLPQSIIAKTAAGEVVERPASVVKELIENAIDANASYIKIEIEKNGLKKIAIMDDGEGMDKQDVLECFKPHTTSKIFTDQDLIGIKTLGFRGEALASIASISKMNIKSRLRKEPIGTTINIEAGKIKDTSSAGMPSGTTIVVEDLFFNTPGRKKFLRTSRTELKHIVSIVACNALSFPNKGFHVTHNKRILLDLPKNQTIEERSKVLLGDTIFSNFFPLSHKETHFRIFGYISKPQVSSQYRNNQYTFINNRYIKSNLIASAAKKAYGTLLDATSHPAFLLFLEVPHDIVDVNVHPRKEAISFHNEQAIFDFVQKAIKTPLKEFDLTYTSDIFGFPLLGRLSRKASPYTFSTLKDSVQLWDMRLHKDQQEYEEVLQVHNLYLITQSKDGLLLIDQHAAHEKILYEQLVDYFEKQKKEQPHKLEEPIIFDLPISDSYTLKENINIFKELGLTIELFGENTFKISSVPDLLKDQDFIKLITEVLEDISQGLKPRDINKKSLQTISYLACRSAIKAGEKLDPEERKSLVEKLMQTKTSYTCPHGRPTMIETSMKDLDKMFRRK